MADDETKEWAARSKQIEEERMKAARDLNGRSEGKENLAFLDPKSTKASGWTKDPDVLLAGVERWANRALIFAIAGAVMGLIGRVGGAVSSVSKLGAAGAIISALPSGIGYLCFGAATLIGVISIGVELYVKIKTGKKFSSAFWTGLVAIVVVTLSFILQQFVGVI